MIMINLLPHREERRRRKKIAFFAGAAVAAVVGAAVVGIWYLAVQQLISGQQGRNAYLSEEIRKLDLQIKDIASLPNEGRDALVALFEIGADTTSLKVLRDDEMLYDRDQAFGGSQLTQLISRQYGFSFEEAEQKKLAADLPDDYETSLLAPFVDSLSQEIGRALQYFFTSTPHHKVHYVMLAGGTATLPGLKDRVTELTGFASMVVNPFENMKLGSAVREAKLRREASSYLTACGLAMRRFVQ